MLNRVVLLLAAVSLLGACSPRNLEAENEVAGSITRDIACDTHQTKIFDSLYKIAETEKTLPPVDDVRERFEENLHADYPQLTARERDQLLEKMIVLYRTLQEDSAKVLTEEDGFPLTRRLAALELGFSDNVQQKALHSDLQSGMADLKATAVALGVECDQQGQGGEDDGGGTTTPPPAENPILKLQNAHWGALKVVGVAYQSCPSLEVAPLTSKSPDVQGITRTGTRDDGGGIRYVTNAPALMQSNPYLKTFVPGGSCRDIRSSPPIYDFGGKPAVTGAALDLFKNGGDGTSALGIDCSGFVSAALLTAGLKLSSSAPIRASHASAYASSNFKRPGESGLDCLAPVQVTPTESLRSGDIVAMDGHVVMVEVPTGDPFGIAGITSVSDCKAGPIAVSKFNFVIVQSSSSKNGIGINRYQAKEYLKDGGSIADGLTQYAIAACQARLNKASSTPNPSTALAIRHKGTAACMAAPVAMVGEECVQSCLPSTGQADLDRIPGT